MVGKLRSRHGPRNFHQLYRLVCRDRICVYCGVYATTIDHFVPASVIVMIADAVSVGAVPGKVLLPSCRECNIVGGDRRFPTVAAKRRFIHLRLAKRYARVLAIPHWSEAELAELGYSLDHFVRHGVATKQWVEQRLQWRNTSNREAVKLAAIRSRHSGNGSTSAAKPTAKRGTTKPVKPSSRPTEIAELKVSG